MPTKWAEIETENAMVFINDIRLAELSQASPARFYRRMALYMKNAYPLFNSPPEMVPYLEEGLVLPEFADFEWESTAESVEGPVTVETGKIGYDICSCASWAENPDGNRYEVPYDGVISYDPETGAVTFPQQQEAGIAYSLDFYKDGEFAQDLTAAQKRILGLCVASVWDERFFRDWTADAPKDHSRSFNPPNEAQYMEKGMKKKMDNRALLDDEMRKYEQTCAYRNTVRRPGLPFNFA